ncbi:MAG: hypothetical protein ACI30I_03035, partial [Parabacteroides sp.]
MKSQIEIYEGRQQINPAAQTAIQNNYFGGVGGVTSCSPKTVIILGAGTDVAIGMPATSRLIPGIVDWLETDEGKAIDEALRKQLKRLTFRFDKFVEDAIDRLAKDLDRERETICCHVRKELEHNSHLNDDQRKMGNLIVRIFQKITDVKKGAAIDEETENLIREVIGLEPAESTIIDFSRLNYTATFKDIIVHILRMSLHESDHPILRHVYRNLLDIEQLLAQYFYGFFTNRPGKIKTYLYIAWMLWGYLVHREQELGSLSSQLIYRQLAGREDIQVVTFNYTTFAAQVSPTALYFNGNLTDYVDIENKNDLQVEDIYTLDLVEFFRHRLPQELSLEGDRVAIPIPSFMPPLKLKPVISDRYITVWYRTSEAIRQADRILILGHSIHTAESFFCDMVRNNRQAEITIINQDMDTVCRNLCATLQLSVSRYTTLTVHDHPARKYDNRITVV